MEHYTDPLNLHPHELNAAVYGTDDLPLEFLRSVEEFGVITPLIVLEDYTIISGHRRWMAAKHLGQYSVPIRIVPMTDDLDIAQAIIESNRQRDKTFSVKMREAEVLRKIEAERADLRQKAGVALSSPEHKVHAPTSDAVAQQVGIGSRATYDRARTVWKKAQRGDKAAEQLVRQLDAGETTIGAAFRELKVSAAEVPPPARVAPGSWGIDPDEPVLRWWEHYPVLKTLHEALDELWELDITEQEAKEVTLWLKEAARGVEGS